MKVSNLLVHTFAVLTLLLLEGCCTTDDSSKGPVVRPALVMVTPDQAVRYGLNISDRPTGPIPTGSMVFSIKEDAVKSTLKETRPEDRAQLLARITTLEENLADARQEIGRLKKETEQAKTN